MKIKFNSDDDLNLRKTLEVYNIVIADTSVFMRTANITCNFS